MLEVVEDAICEFEVVVVGARVMKVEFEAEHFVDDPSEFVGGGSDGSWSAVLGTDSSVVGAESALGVGQ